MSMRQILNGFLELLFPSRCVFCGKILKETETGFCARCQKTLPWILFYAADQSPEFVSGIVAPLWFRDSVRESVHRYKFYDRNVYSKTYGHLVAQCVSDHLADKYDLITWVPLSAKGLKKRGYDQAKLLAVAAAEELNVEVVETLRKVRHTGTQSHLTDDAARRANVLGAYEIVDSALVEGKRVLLIDDVITTGTTVSECARILRTSGAADVVCASLARARTNL